MSSRYYVLSLLFSILYTAKHSAGCRELDFHWSTIRNYCQNVILHCLSFANQISPLVLFYKIWIEKSNYRIFRLWVTKSMTILYIWWVNIDFQTPTNIITLFSKWSSVTVAGIPFISMLWRSVYCSWLFFAISFFRSLSSSCCTLD